MLALGVALSGAPALAQTAQDLAAARQIFNDGKELEKLRDWAGALEKFKKVAGVKMTPQVRFHIALCEENLGNFASAMRGFQLAAEEARLAGSTAAEVAEKAPPRVEALRKRIGMLKIEVTGKVITSKILLDGLPVVEASFGVELPVNPGDHVVEVNDASGKSTFRKQLTIREQGAERVSVEINDEPLPLPPPKVIIVAPPPTPQPSRAPVFIAGGTGLAFLLASGALFAAEQVTIFDVSKHCPPFVLPKCESAYKFEADLGQLYLTLSEISLGVGVAGLATAGILWFALTPKKSAPSKAAISISPAGPGIVIRGVF
jgi:hypothetical protein